MFFEKLILAQQFTLLILNLKSSYETFLFFLNLTEIYDRLDLS